MKVVVRDDGSNSNYDEKNIEAANREVDARERDLSAVANEGTGDVKSGEYEVR